jgi:hypothetical protein
MTPRMRTGMRVIQYGVSIETEAKAISKVRAETTEKQFRLGMAETGGFTRCAVSRIIAKLCFGVPRWDSGSIPALMQPLLHPAV